MIEWNDKSDRASRFFDGQIRGDSRANADDILKDVFEFLLTSIVGEGNAVDFDCLLLEVNCDTGRVLAAATTNENRDKGMIDGCSVRIQELQDHWYDLLEGGASDEEFSLAIANKVTELGQAFRSFLVKSLDDLRRNCAEGGFNYILYGNDPGVSYLDEHFPS